MSSRGGRGVVWGWLEFNHYLLSHVRQAGPPGENTERQSECSQMVREAFYMEIPTQRLHSECESQKEKTSGQIMKALSRGAYLL